MKRLVRLTVVHELGHACDLDHHNPNDEGGFPTCPMRNLTKNDKLFKMAHELINPTNDPLPLGVAGFCAAPDNCEKQFRLKGR